jgi:HlyD family type I secretion membrane fusion protein
LAGARAALAEAESRKRSIEKEWRRDGLADLGRATAERDRLWEKLQAHDALLDGLVVTAPVDGIIQEVAITGEGQSIAANLPVMKLVPVEREMVVQADVSNDDISKIKTGMPAAIKIRAYDFIRFGTFDGTVQQINRDSHQNQEGTGYNYRVRIATDLAQAKPDLDILPGMLVSVELKVGSRTILSYMTDRIIEWRERAFTDS